MKRSLGVSGLLLLMGASWAQMPDVSIFADLAPTLRQDRDGLPVLRWSDPEGKVSVVGLRMVLENGARVKLAQRLQRIPGDPDSLDEAWINVNQEWQAGKQYLPFGKKFIIRESVPAILFSTRLVLSNVPADVAAFDGGEGRPRGVSFRVGGPDFGVSGMVGDHLGVQGTSLSPFRSPGQAPGKGRGWQTILGVDGAVKAGSTRLEGELVIFRNGHQEGDVNLGCTDIRAYWIPSGSKLKFEGAWSRSWSESLDIVRLAMTAPLSEKASLRPQIRLDKDGVRDLSVTCVLKL